MQEYNQQYYDPASYWQSYSQAWAGYYGDQSAAANVDVTTQMSQSVPIADTTVAESVIIDNDFELIGMLMFNEQGYFLMRHE